MREWKADHFWGGTSFVQRKKQILCRRVFRRSRRRRSSTCTRQGPYHPKFMDGTFSLEVPPIAAGGMTSAPFRPSSIAGAGTLLSELLMTSIHLANTSPTCHFDSHSLAYWESLCHSSMSRMPQLTLVHDKRSFRSKFLLAPPLVRSLKSCRAGQTIILPERLL